MGSEVGSEELHLNFVPSLLLPSWVASSEVGNYLSSEDVMVEAVFSPSLGSYTPPRVSIILSQISTPGQVPDSPILSSFMETVLFDLIPQISQLSLYLRFPCD